jgi:hypothetical protein
MACAESVYHVGDGVRTRAGNNLKPPIDQVALENLKPLLDAWTKDAV